MKMRTSTDGDEFALNLTSMTDIVFLMLIFFMLVTTYDDPERQLDVELPAASSSREPPPQDLVINVLEDGSVVLDGLVLERAALRLRLDEAARAEPATPVTIRGHRLARHEAIVRVLDDCGAAGLSNLSVATTQEERG